MKKFVLVIYVKYFLRTRIFFNSRIYNMFSNMCFFVLLQCLLINKNSTKDAFCRRGSHGNCNMLGRRHPSNRRRNRRRCSRCCNRNNPPHLIRKPMAKGNYWPGSLLVARMLVAQVLVAQMLNPVACSQCSHMWCWEIQDLTSGPNATMTAPKTFVCNPRFQNCCAIAETA